MLQIGAIEARNGGRDQQISACFLIDLANTIGADKLVHVFL